MKYLALLREKIEMKKITSNRSGLIGGILSIIFFFCFLTLGFLQPNYNHVRDTISMLVEGKFGWVQTINFWILFLSTIFIFWGLGKNINKNKAMKIFLGMSLLEIIVILIFPTNRPFFQQENFFASLSLAAKIHYLTTFLLMITITFLTLSVVSCMKKNLVWKKMINYSYFVLFFNLIFGTIWFYFNQIGFLFEWKGLFQKIIVVNVLVWLCVVGFKLWKLESKSGLGI